MRNTIAMVLAASLVCMTGAGAQPFPFDDAGLFEDITSSDRVGTGVAGGWYDLLDSTEWGDRLLYPYGVSGRFNEDDESEPASSVGQEWDLEGFFMDKDPDQGLLYLVSGYDHENDPAAGNDGYGDLFFDFTDDAVYGPDVGEVSPDNNGEIPNTFGYDAVARFDFSTGLVHGYLITSETLLRSVWYDAMEQSNPWRLSDSQWVYEVGVAPFGYTKGLASEDVGGLSGPFHNVLSFGVYELFGPWFGDWNMIPFRVHYTNWLGSDSIVGHATNPWQQLPLICDVEPDAGPDQVGFVGESVFLDSSETQLAAYTWWQLVSSPPGCNPEFLGDRITIPCFGEYKITLHAVGYDDCEETDSVSVYTANRAPVAVASPPESVVVGTEVCLDGFTSYDLDGHEVYCRWLLTSSPDGSSADLFSSDGASASFTADKPGPYQAVLTVRDPFWATDMDTVLVTATNATAVARVDAANRAWVGQTVHLDGNASSDADGHALGFSWTLSVPIGSYTVLCDPDSASPVFTADVPGSYGAELTVSDGFSASAPASATIDIGPGGEHDVVFVSFPHGDDNGSGSTQADPLATMRKAQEEVVLGGRVFLAPGETDEVLWLDKPMRVEAPDGPACVGVY